MRLLQRPQYLMRPVVTARSFPPYIVCPDRAQAMKQTHSSADAYVTWLREQGLESLDDPRPNVPHDQVPQELAEKKAPLHKRAPDSEARF
ncbi:hypothetical protein [Caballeronia sp. GAFFF1]|uniref:antitoxin PaaA2 family protein n=1 Tax=Caballeronia sp. GAFFF1 TaxID=2921779 RepID=UPI0032ED5969